MRHRAACLAPLRTMVSTLGRAGAGALLAVATLGAARAAEPPSTLFPQADALVEYNVTLPGNDHITMTLAWNVEAGLLRLSATSEAEWLLHNRNTGLTLLINDRRRSYSVLDRLDAMAVLPDIPPAAQLEAQGSDRVLDTPCELWHVTREEPGFTTFCLTADGLLLKAGIEMAGGRSGLSLEARRVVQGRQELSLFTVPPGYRKISR